MGELGDESRNDPEAGLCIITRQGRYKQTL